MNGEKHRGAALVELALTLPVLLVLVMGIIEMASLFQQFQVVQHAAREGARLAAVGESPEEVTAAVLNLLSLRSFAGTPTIRVEEVTLSSYVESKVSISVPLRTVTPLGQFVPALLGTFRPTAVAAFRKEG
ncbi:MAG TPA: TadE/TadG family type IV pilus assembly protein [Synergistales bacterium]|nr:TadE/TadG family type IV pilus assembly protein [Synergistales bacterium]